MVLIGFGKRTYKDFGPGDAMACAGCGNFARFKLLKERVWFTYFFIPLLPYRLNHLQVCPLCGYRLEVSRAQFEASIVSAQADRAYLLS